MCELSCVSHAWHVCSLMFQKTLSQRAIKGRQWKKGANEYNLPPSATHARRYSHKNKCLVPASDFSTHTHFKKYRPQESARYLDARKLCPHGTFTQWGSCASSPKTLPWCTCDSVTWPRLQHGSRVPWLMFYKLPKGSWSNSVPTLPLCGMHCVWDYIPSLRSDEEQLHRGQSPHQPKNAQKIRIEVGVLHTG